MIVGESSSYTYDNICRAVRCVQKGARLIGTNSDLTGPTEQGIVPACRALVAPIELATGKEAYYIGKPNPLMMRTGINLLGGHSQDTVIIGDRMDTDIVAGIECGLDTVLVPLSPPAGLAGGGGHPGRGGGGDRASGVRSGLRACPPRDGLFLVGENKKP